LDKAKFNLRIFSFFSNYLTNKKTQYVWNNFVSSYFRADIDISQGSTLSSIFSTLYIIPIFHIFKKRTKNLLSNISVSTLSFVNDGLIISQGKGYKKSNAKLFCSYSIIFKQFGLIIEYNKSEVFHFSRAIKNFNLPSLDLGPLE